MAFIDIGGTPVEEDCASIGVTNDASWLNQLECRAYIKALERKYGQAPAGCRFSIRGNSHDFGTYYEVRFVFPDDDVEGSLYALKVENGLATWAEVGMKAPVVYERSQPVSVIIDPAQLVIGAA